MNPNIIKSTSEDNMPTRKPNEKLAKLSDIKISQSSIFTLSKSGTNNIKNDFRYFIPSHYNLSISKSRDNQFVG